MENEHESNFMGIAKVVGAISLVLGLPISISYVLSLNSVKPLQREKMVDLLHQRNVIGNEAPEKFYEVNGQRAYLEIDGKPVEQYFK